jgi:hypothetical protein
MFAEEQELDHFLAQLCGTAVKDSNVIGNNGGVKGKGKKTKHGLSRQGGGVHARKKSARDGGGSSDGSLWDEHMEDMSTNEFPLQQGKKLRLAKASLTVDMPDDTSDFRDYAKMLSDDLEKEAKKRCGYCQGILDISQVLLQEIQFQLFLVRASLLTAQENGEKRCLNGSLEKRRCTDQERARVGLRRGEENGRVDESFGARDSKRGSSSECTHLANLPFDLKRRLSAHLW